MKATARPKAPTKSRTTAKATPAAKPKTKAAAPPAKAAAKPKAAAKAVKVPTKTAPIGPPRCRGHSQAACIGEPSNSLSELVVAEKVVGLVVHP